MVRTSVCLEQAIANSQETTPTCPAFKLGLASQVLLRNHCLRRFWCSSFRHREAQNIFVSLRLAYRLAHANCASVPRRQVSSTGVGSIAALSTESGGRMAQRTLLATSTSQADHSVATHSHCQTHHEAAGSNAPPPSGALLFQCQKPVLKHL